MHVKEVFFFCRLEQLSFFFKFNFAWQLNDTHSYSYVHYYDNICECVCVYVEWKYDSMQKVSLVHTMECQLWCGRNKVINKLEHLKGKKNLRRLLPNW